MNTPNKLTLSRIILSPIYLIIFLQPNPYCKIAGFVIFILAALTDVADGHYARKYGIVTGFGKFMDPLADKILVVTAFIALVDLGLIRAWMVALIVGREFYVTGLRSLAAYRGALIMPSRIAKLKTFLQMSGIVFIMLVVLLDSIYVLYESQRPAFLHFDRQLVYDIVIGIATTATLYTGFDYTVKYYSMLKNILR
jgi:CDP-diacylglycerol--glycerol-3-phosphate 3-phosphatidyltransferase